MRSPKARLRNLSNWIGGEEAVLRSLFTKINPHDGRALCRVSRSGQDEVSAAVRAAQAAQMKWAETPAVVRGRVLAGVATALKRRRREVARVVALETGKSPQSALAETDAAAELGMFYAGEGRRFYGRTTTSAAPHRQAMTVREPMGVAALIVAANTPIANVAWKVFPALICGNAVVLKSSEDAPMTAWIFGRIAREAGLPAGVLNVVHGFGGEAGAPLVSDPGVDVLSFTGSSEVGREIAALAGRRLLKLSLELGGKNPFVVCEDADLDEALRWALLSAFSNAGQRCASASRIIVCRRVYETFKARFTLAASRLCVGNTDADDYGPVINASRLESMLAGIRAAKKRGARVLTGGTRLATPKHRRGFYLEPTVIEGAKSSDPISREELFGPITCLYRAENFEKAVRLTNDSPFGLTASIHTSSLHRAMEFTRRVKCGVVSVNAGTHGSEPHMPFGGVKASGNGTREPGTEALDIYSNLKSATWASQPEKV